MHDDIVRYLPYPEVVEGGFDAPDYEIHDSNLARAGATIGMVNKIDRVMLVPLSEDGLTVRRHELAHVKWSPRKLPKVPFDRHILLAVEDARINSALRLRGLACPEPPRLHEYILKLAARDLSENAYGVFVLRCIASIGSDELAPLLDLAALAAPDAYTLAARLAALVENGLAASVRCAPHRGIASFHTAVRLAAAVAAELERAGVRITDASHRRLLVEGGFCLSCEARKVLAECIGLRGRGGAEDREAAKMRLAEPDLPIVLSVPGKRRPDGYRALREGAIVRGASRWFSDRRIFRGRTRRGGGTVLIDTSSSMRLTAADVERIMKGAPAATLVAIYSGRHGEGELRIVARDGRRASAEQLTPFGPGNLIDLPALEWLAKQPAPRVWLSDGRVTGVNDFASRYLARRCRLVCLKNGIRRAETSGQAAAILEGRPTLRLPVMV